MIDENGDIRQNFILNKLKNKTNWIAEFMTIKRAIPKEWIDILQSESSIKTTVNIDKCSFSFGRANINLKDLNNKYIYKSLISQKIQDNIGIKKWENKFNIELTQSEAVFKFIHQHVLINNIKMFRWKLITYILPTQESLFTWNIENSPLCRHCGKIDNYQHFFIDCNLLETFWEKIYITLKSIGFSKKISLPHLVIGYKINDCEYWDLNVILTLISFSIYKTFYISEQRSKMINAFEIFKKEFRLYVNLRMKLNKKQSKLLNRVCNILIDQSP